ncbi:hypothetical protein ACVXHA_16745 [Escherichia coli]
MNYGKRGRESGAGTPGLGPFRASSDLQLVPIRSSHCLKRCRA